MSESVKIKHTVFKKEVYPSIDVHMKPIEVEVEVTYVPVGISKAPMQAGDTTEVVFETSIDQCNLNGTYRLEFIYNGEDTIYAEAIKALQASFSQE